MTLVRFFPESMTAWLPLQRAVGEQKAPVPESGTQGVPSYFARLAGAVQRAVKTRARATSRSACVWPG